MAKKINYESAFEELQNILLELEKDTISIDELPVKIKRANELLTFCKEKLKNTELEIHQLMNGKDDEKLYF